MSMLSSTVGNGVCRVTLNRPDKRNALHPDLIEELTGLFAAAGDDPSFQVILLTGAGPGFCAGLDIGHLLALDPEARIEYLRQLLALFRQQLRTPQPIVAAVNGHAIAGGFDLAAFCDIRFAQPAAKFAQSEIILGMTQIFHPLYKVIGMGLAKELALTGLPISAQRAYEIGFVNHLVPAERLLDESSAFAETLAQRPRGALFATKALANALIDIPSDDAFEMMAERLYDALRSREHSVELAAYAQRLGIGRDASVPAGATNGPARS